MTEPVLPDCLRNIITQSKKENKMKKLGCPLPPNPKRMDGKGRLMIFGVQNILCASYESTLINETTNNLLFFPDTPNQACLKWNRRGPDMHHPVWPQWYPLDRNTRNTPGNEVDCIQNI